MKLNKKLTSKINIKILKLQLLELCLVSMNSFQQDNQHKIFKKEKKRIQNKLVVTTGNCMSSSFQKIVVASQMKKKVGHSLKIEYYESDELHLILSKVLSWHIFLFFIS